MTTTINAASAGLVSTADSSTALALQTAGTTAITINSSQQVGIGNTTPNTDLGVTGEIYASGNITGGNINTGGTISATGNITVSTNGRIGVGTTSPDTELTILANPQTVSYSITGNSTTTGTDLHISGADGTQTRITQDAFGTSQYVAFTGRSARGTAAAPTQTQSGDTISQFTGRGFSVGNLQFGNASTGRVDVVAAENFTDTSRATNVQIFTTAASSITPTAVATFSSATGLSIAGNITGSNISAGLAKSTSVFTSGAAATYTAPANTNFVKITVVGPGGSGGGTTTARATGGGGGGVSIKWQAMTAGQTLTYTVGTASGTASTVASGTLVIATITANSGVNGTQTTYALSITAGAAGGTASGGDVNITGGQGGYSYGSSTTVATNFSGAGGSCPGFGSGGPALAMVITAAVAGNGFGAGGGGAHGSITTAAGTGGVIIFEAF